MIQTCGLEECVRQGRAAIGWDQKYNNPAWHAGAGSYPARGLGRRW